jgi:hypothetical protein
MFLGLEGEGSITAPAVACDSPHGRPDRRWGQKRLPNRRSHWLYRFESGGQFYTGGIGRFDDGRIAEIFINGPKVGSAAEANAQDAAIVTSLALQYGCPLETIRHALARSGGGAGPLAMLLDEVERQSEDARP